MKKRRKFSAGFKTQIALEALTGESTLAELSSKYSAHANTITKWKKEECQVDHESEIKDLHAKIGQLTAENDFLQKPLLVADHRTKAATGPRSATSFKYQPSM